MVVSYPSLLLCRHVIYVTHSVHDFRSLRMKLLMLLVNWLTVLTCDLGIGSCKLYVSKIKCSHSSDAYSAGPNFDDTYVEIVARQLLQIRLSASVQFAAITDTHVSPLRDRMLYTARLLLTSIYKADVYYVQFSAYIRTYSVLSLYDQLSCTERKARWN
jgi:hypothetical protein